MAPAQRPERGMRIDQATWRRQEVCGVWKEQHVQRLGSKRTAHITRAESREASRELLILNETPLIKDTYF